jgi:serine/threonine-protein kinase
MTDFDSSGKRLPPSDLTGHALGDYRILRRLGSGAMAHVYLAEQASLGRKVALKVLKQEFVDDQTYVKRFSREARAAAQLAHVNIVQIFEVGQIEGLHYISQEYVHGINLQALLRKKGSLDPSRVTAIMWQVASALDKASRQGIIHRDIKPENILVNESWEVKVADFGLARILDPTEDDGLNLTQIGITLGTPLYMSPEQTEGNTLDIRSDIYSLGVTSYQMLAGHPPFTGDTPLSVAVQHLRKPAEPLENIRDDIPPPLARVVHKMLAKEPEARYENPRLLQRDLKQIQSQYFSETNTWEVLPDWEQCMLEEAERNLLATTEQLNATMQMENRFRRSRWQKGLLAVAFLGAFLAGGWLAFSQARKEPDFTAEVAGPSTIEKKETVGRQWLYAARLGTEEAWQSVIDYFPEHRHYWGRKAKQQLAFHYLINEEDQKAEAIFQEFVDLGDSEPRFYAFGLSGLVWIYARSDQLDRAKSMLNELLELGGDSWDPQVRQLLRRATEIIQMKEGAVAGGNWNDQMNRLTERIEQELSEYQATESIPTGLPNEQPETEQSDAPDRPRIERNSRNEP